MAPHNSPFLCLFAFDDRHRIERLFRNLATTSTGPKNLVERAVDRLIFAINRDPSHDIDREAARRCWKVLSINKKLSCDFARVVLESQRSAR